MKRPSGRFEMANTGKINAGQSGLSAVFSRLVRLFDVYGNAPPTELKQAASEPVVVAEPALISRSKSRSGDEIAGVALARAFDALHMPVVIVSERLLVLHANEEARHVFGERIAGRSLSLFLRDPKVVDDIESTIADGQARQADISMDVPLKRRYKLNISRLPKRMLEPMQVVLEFQEVTLIQRSESMRSEFVANVSHELRSPLATLVGFIETLKDNGDDAQARDRFLDIMDGEAQRMRRLIDDLLSLTNVELREHERPRARIDLEGVIKEVANALAARARSCEVEVHLDAADNLPAAMGDRDQLIQVFNNLITNAIKYGGDGHRIDVSIKPLPDGMPDGGPSVEVWVRDYGQGIDAEHLPRLTERFYRVDKGRSRAVGGTGLGLAIVKHIVNRHRGRLLIESERGKGSLFKVRLPIYREAEPVDPATKL